MFLGIQAVISKINEHYYLKNCFKLVSEYIGNCEACQKNDPSTAITPLIPIIPTGTFLLLFVSL